MPGKEKDYKTKLKKDPKELITEEPVKKRGGRPRTKTENCKTINIAIPESLLEKIAVAKVMHGGNLTLYINRLIERDIQENYEKYKEFAEMLQCKGSRTF